MSMVFRDSGRELGQWVIWDELVMVRQLTELGHSALFQFLVLKWYSDKILNHALSSSYNTCDLGTLPNQTNLAGTGPAATLTTGTKEFDGLLSYQPGQRVSCVKLFLLLTRKHVLMSKFLRACT